MEPGTLEDIKMLKSSDFFLSYGPHSKVISNPLTNEVNDCILLNTKKDKYYIHTYNPIPIIEKLKRLGIAEDIINSKFDITPRTNCCNAISITLYFKDCENYLILEKYLFSIYRTVKNVNKKLKNWIVRLYFDSSVHDCINKLENVRKTDMIQIETIIKIYKTIKYSSNVEIYTFSCKSVANNTIPLEETRTFRFLTLIDPTVNISVIREADGYLNNLECHNIKMFEESDKIFYLPIDFIGSENLKIIFRERQKDRYYLTSNSTGDGLSSYSKWLKLYKLLINFKYFKDNQNIYDLLAGLFSTKLKIKPEFYSDTIRDLREKMNKVITCDEYSILFEGDKKEFNIGKVVYSRDNIHTLKKHIELPIYDPVHSYSPELNPFIFNKRMFSVGFDEILLLDIYKEVISIPVNSILKAVHERSDLEPNTKEIFDRINDLFYATNIKTFIYGHSATINDVIEELIKEGVIQPEVNYTDIIPVEKIFPQNREKIDAYVLSKIIAKYPFSIYFEGLHLSSALNKPYKLEFDKYYDYDIDVVEPATTRTIKRSISNSIIPQSIINSQYSSDDLTLIKKKGMSYLEKYLKYKKKYLELKKELN